MLTTEKILQEIYAGLKNLRPVNKQREPRNEQLLVNLTFVTLWMEKHIQKLDFAVR